MVPLYYLDHNHNGEDDSHSTSSNHPPNFKINAVVISNDACKNEEANDCLCTAHDQNNEDVKDNNCSTSNIHVPSCIDAVVMSNNHCKSEETDDHLYATHNHNMKCNNCPNAGSSIHPPIAICGTNAIVMSNNHCKNEETDDCPDTTDNQSSEDMKNDDCSGSRSLSCNMNTVVLSNEHHKETNDHLDVAHKQGNEGDNNYCSNSTSNIDLPIASCLLL